MCMHPYKRNYLQLESLFTRPLTTKWAPEKETVRKIPL